MRYFLIGYKSSGKSTIGIKFAKRLSLEFIDLDDLIEQREGKSIPQLYSELGETKFRNREWKALLEAIKKDNVVIALGGGAPCHCDNMNLIEKYGKVIYLRLDNDTLISRLKKATKDRPIVLNKSDEELRHYVRDIRDRCEHHYLRAHYIVEAKDLTVERIISIIQPEGDKNSEGA